jgi:hypothetical protein
MNHDIQCGPKQEPDMAEKPKSELETVTQAKVRTRTAPMSSCVRPKWTLFDAPKTEKSWS